ncbi:MAPEG family protein [Ruegeria sp. HKCCD8929]|uniref:MAPEG family protein n=1 Tax=Ruegeria sp. HKCCD8929 TaxID=2683006 RepID=UPI001489758F|nr:MAPEG family protein [Ruegeria sp. HKCCD8929]
MQDLSLPITTFLASSLLGRLLILSWRVIRARQSGGPSLGDDGDKSLQRKIRAQANLAEYAPLFVVLIAILELQDGNWIILTILSLMFLAGRLAHGYALAFTQRNVTGRLGGMGLTIAAAALAVIHGFAVMVF